MYLHVDMLSCTDLLLSACGSSIKHSSWVYNIFHCLSGKYMVIHIFQKDFYLPWMFAGLPCLKERKRDNKKIEKSCVYSPPAFPAHSSQHCLRWQRTAPLMTPDGARPLQRRGRRIPIHFQWNRTLTLALDIVGPASTPGFVENWLEAAAPL